MLERLIERGHRMDDRVWARHASGWSVWTRFATFPVLLLAIWSHAWIGWWALAAIAAVVLWLWINPRLFPPPRSTRSWHARATFGERVWLNRGAVPIPRHHVLAASVLQGIAGVGALLAVGGAVLNLIWWAVLGAVFVYAGKMWFLDRMVWLFEDMKDREPRYRAWLR